MFLKPSSLRSQENPAPDSPARLAWDLQKARYQAESVAPAAAVEPVGAPRYASQALHVPGHDNTANQQASAVTPPTGPRLAQVPKPFAAPAAPAGGANELLTLGEEALKRGDLTAAWRYFQQANSQRAELDAVAQARIDTHLKMLATAPVEPRPGAPARTGAATGGAGFRVVDVRHGRCRPASPGPGRCPQMLATRPSKRGRCVSRSRRTLLNSSRRCVAKSSPRS